MGILDADLNGPSIGHLLGVGNDLKLETKDNGIEPGDGYQGIKIMSMDMLLKTADTPVMWTEEADATAVWVSTMESTAIRELLADTNWGELDYLIVDLPPGGAITGLRFVWGGHVPSARESRFPFLSRVIHSPFTKALAKPEIQYSIRLSLISCTITAFLSLWVAITIGYLMSR